MKKRFLCLCMALLLALTLIPPCVDRAEAESSYPVIHLNDYKPLSVSINKDGYPELTWGPIYVEDCPGSYVQITEYYLRKRNDEWPVEEYGNGMLIKAASSMVSQGEYRYVDKDAGADSTYEYELVGFVGWASVNLRYVNTGDKVSITIPKKEHTHKYTSKVTKPTCIAQGYTTHTCSCGDSYKDAYTEALGHNWNSKVTKAATEKSTGIRTYTCTRCGVSREEIIPVSKHTHKYTAKVTAPTYTAKGYTSHTCSCGDSYKDNYTAKKKLAAPKISSITNTSDGIKVKWNKITGATGYQVWRKAGSGEWKLLKTITSGSTTSLTNTKKADNGTKYQYKVRAIAKKDGEIVNTGSYSAVKTMYRLTRPTISSAKNTAAKKITVKWSKNSKATGYQVKYIRSDTTKTVKVKGSGSLSKVLSSLTKGETYKIYVRAYKTVDSKTYYSAYSAFERVKVTR